MSTRLPPDGKTFWISFNTKTARATGCLTGVKITIERDVLAADETAFINLIEHPLYSELERYVLANLKARRKS